MMRYVAGIRQHFTKILGVALLVVMTLALAGCTLGNRQQSGSLVQSIEPDLFLIKQQLAPVAFDEMPFAAKRAHVVAQGTTQTTEPTVLVSSYVGGDGADYGKDVAVDAAGNIYVLGQTFSDVLFDEEIARAGYSDVFVAKFDPTGSELLYYKVIGGNDSEIPLSVEVDAQGNVYGTASTYDETFPTLNALWTEPVESANGVLFKLDANGEMVYSTYLPVDVFYSRHNLAVDAAGNAYVVGSYPWVTVGEDEWLRSQIALLKFDPTGAELLLDLNFGGTGTDRGIAIALDQSGNMYLAGSTSEGDGFPVTENAHQPECGDLIYEPDSYCYDDSIVMVLNPAGEVTYASYHGGSFTDTPNAIGTDGKGHVMIAGDTASSRFPFVNALQDTCTIASYSDDCESGRAYVSVIHIPNLQTPDNGDTATVTFSTYLGSTERNSNNTVMSAAMDDEGNAYVAGYTSGKKFPLVNAVQDELYESFCYTFSSERYCFDAFVTKFSPSGELLFGSYLGGEFDEFPYGLTVDPQGAIYVVGTTEASYFPTTANAYEPVNLINDDAFFVKIGMPVVSKPHPRPAPNGFIQLALPALLR